MLRQRPLGGLILVVWLSVVAWPKDNPGFTLRSPSYARGDTNIYVGVSPQPTAGTFQDCRVWAVVYKTMDDPVGARIGVVRCRAASNYAQTGQVILSLERAVPNDAASIEITYMVGDHPSVTWRPKKKLQGQTDSRQTPAHTTSSSGNCFSGFGFNKATAKDANVNLTGSWIPAVGAKPTYSIDGTVALRCEVTTSLSFELDGKVKTADKKNADPDSFSTGISMIYNHFPGQKMRPVNWEVEWGIVDWEFSRKEESFNFVTSPTGTVVWTAKPGINFDVSFGAEVGTNLRNHITEIRNGYGTIARLTPGASAYLVKNIGTNKLSWTTLYRPRVLLTEEPLIDHRRAVPVSLARGTRESISNTLNWQVGLFAITLKHEYGSLPPAFEFVDHKATIGLTVMWKWKDK